MANQLKMAKVHSILTLREQGWSQRRIARALGVDRGTVARHLRAAGAAKAAIAPPGADPADKAVTADAYAANAANAPTGSTIANANTTEAPTGSFGSDAPYPLIGSVVGCVAPAAANVSNAANAFTGSPATNATDAPIGSTGSTATDASIGSTGSTAANAPIGSVVGCVAPAAANVSNAANALTGSPGPDAVHQGPNAARSPISASGHSSASVPVGSPGDTSGDSSGGASVGSAIASSGRTSDCEPHRAFIQERLEQGLSAVRIHQDLTVELNAAVSYHSVRRFVGRLARSRPAPFRRMESPPGEEAQVDFGTGAPIVSAEGQRRRTHLFRIVLSHSRKAYSEAVFRQTTDDFIRCIENAFHHFGGVPKTLVIDNLKAGVIKADWFDPELNPKLAAFATHHGTVILPTKPYTPRHKGKVERMVAYAQDNALKGRTFTTLDEQNRHLREWETRVADTRIHGTTRQQVHQAFERERPALLPLPAERFPLFTEAKRKVNRDGHVEVAKAYYSAPPEYVGHEVWARWDSRTVRIYNGRFEQIAMHVRHDPGRFSTQATHIPQKKRSGVEQGATRLLSKATLIGPEAGQWATRMLEQRGIEGVRVLLGLLSLTRRQSAEAIERACATATTHGCYRLKTVRALIGRQGDRQEQFEFIEEHPLIRSLSEYGDLVHAAFTQEDRP